MMNEYNFHDVSMDDKAWIKAKLAEDDNNSYERSFATIFLYRKLYRTQVAEIKGCFIFRCIFKTMNENVPFWNYYFPIGAGDKKGALEVMLALCREEGIPLFICPILAKEREMLLEWFPGQFMIDSNRDYYDYIYSREKLAFLKGKKMQKKRNHIARFKDNEDWSYEPLTRQNLPETRFMAHNWICSRTEKWNEDMENEFSVLEDAFVNYEPLGLQGGLLRQNGDIVAFTMGEPLNSDTFLVHFEKAFPEVHGAYPMINQQFVQHATEGFAYINREDDMGDVGLRKAKLSYYPEILLKKYVAESSDVVMADPVRDRDAIKEMWERCFGDSPEFIDFYMANRMNELNMLVIYQDGKAVTMASFLPVDIQGCEDNLEGYYVYAVATLPEYQGRGLSSKLMTFAKKHWQKPFLLNPAEPELRDFYAKQGFKLMYEPQSYALQPDENNGECTAEFAPITAKEYKRIRDAKWQGSGYVAWLEADIDYAMKHAAFQQGESLALHCEHGEGLVMYTVDGDKMRIVETTLDLDCLPEFLPILVQRFRERHPEHVELTYFEYRLPDGMIWLPDTLKDTCMKRNGYFNLILD